jgi:hypothetical protein
MSGYSCLKHSSGTNLYKTHSCHSPLIAAEQSSRICLASWLTPSLPSSMNEQAHADSSLRDLRQTRLGSNAVYRRHGGRLAPDHDVQYVNAPPPHLSRHAMSHRQENPAGDRLARRQDTGRAYAPAGSDIGHLRGFVSEPVWEASGRMGLSGIHLS